MAENSAIPSILIEMAKLALWRETGGLMVRIPCFFIILFVTVQAGYSRSIEAILAMTLYTVQRPVLALQRIAGRCRVIPLVRRDIFPGVRSVAVAAMRPQPELITVILTALPVAGLTLSRSSLEYQIQMTVGTGSGPVFPYKGKIGVVMGLHRPLRLNLLFLSYALPLSEDPKRSESDKNEQYFL